MPVSLLTPIAQDLSITEDPAGLAIAVSAGSTTTSTRS
jgi:predicted MFS family arabinose efflux permease